MVLQRRCIVKRKQKWNKGQLQTINYNEGSVVVSASAGSGKTTTIIHRIKRLLEERITRPENILATTFTKKAAQEMDDRLVSLGVNTNRISVQTFHSFCYRLLMKTPEYKTWKVDDTDKAKRILKKILGYKEMDWKRSDSSLVMDFISSQRNQLIPPEESNHEDYRYVKAYFFYDEKIHKESLLTFDDMCYFTVKLLQTNEKLRNKIQRKYQYVIVDEFQDVNKAQLELCDIIAKPEYNYMVIGDVDQCQPTGTLIQTPNGQIPIEKLKDGDHVSVWNRHSARITGNRSIKITSRQYNGDLLNIQTKDYSTKATSDHKFFVRWNREIDCCVVYIMYRKDRGYRVGWCKLFTNSPRTFHLGQRTRLEKADKSWILKVFYNKQDVSVYESIVSIKWQIPTVIFNPQKTAPLYTEEGLQKIFENANPNHAIKCLRDHGLHEDYPIYTRNTIIRKRNTIFITQACNIIPGLMKVPVNIKSNNIWQNITNVTKEKYSGNVYSMNVSLYKNYIADNIVTHNCLYAFRGSIPDYMIDFQEKYNSDLITLNYNYRCPPNIFNSAFTCVKNNEKRITVDARPFKTKEKKIEYRIHSDVNEQAIDISEKIRSLTVNDDIKFKDNYVLLRTNAQTRPFEEVFSKDEIPFVIHGPFCFYDRKEIKTLLCYLRLALDNNDYVSGDYIINKPFRFISRKIMDEISNEMSKRNVSYLEACDLIGEKNYYNSTVLKTFVNIIDDIRLDDSPSKAMSEIVDVTKYEKWLVREYGSDDLENDKILTVNELISSALRFTTVKDFIVFVDEQIANMIKNKKKKNRNAVQVMSYHKAKGLQAKSIFLPDANEGIIPHRKAENIEEERRIWYVGMTRSEKYLYVSSTYSNGEKSRFIKESQIKNSDNNNINEKTGT